MTTQVDRRLGTWDDVAALAARMDVMADVIVHHISRRSAQSSLPFTKHQTAPGEAVTLPRSWMPLHAAGIRGSRVRPTKTPATARLGGHLQVAHSGGRLPRDGDVVQVAITTEIDVVIHQRS